MLDAADAVLSGVSGHSDEGGWAYVGTYIVGVVVFLIVSVLAIALWR